MQPVGFSDGQPGQVARRPRLTMASMPNIAECPHQAFALYDAGMLETWFTGLYYRPDSNPIPAKFTPALRRRYHPGLDPACVTELRTWEISRLLVNRLPMLPPPLARRLSLEATVRFTKQVANRLDPQTCDAVFGVTQMALETFTRAKELGLSTVLSMRTAHPRTRYAAVTSELRRRGVEDSRFLESTFITITDRESREVELADIILCPSESVRDSLIDNGIPTERIYLLPFGVDVGQYQNNSGRHDDGTYRFLYVGSMSYRKGIPYLLDAFTSIPTTNLELLLVGGLDDIPPIALSKDPRIRYVGWKNPDDLAKLYHSADAFVLPSLSEGSALVSYEAMAAGLPVIATRASGTLVRDQVDGYLVDPTDTETLADRMRALYLHQELGRDMGRSGAQRVREFSWARYYRDLPILVQQGIRNSLPSHDATVDSRSSSKRRA